MGKKTYLVRFWVDVRIDAETEDEAKAIADQLPIPVAGNAPGIALSDIQVAEIALEDPRTGMSLRYFYGHRR